MAINIEYKIMGLASILRIGKIQAAIAQSHKSDIRKIIEDVIQVQQKLINTIEALDYK